MAKNPKAVAAGKRARTKGKVWERFVVRMLHSIWPNTYRGHQDSRGGAKAGEGCDVEGTPFYIECRHEQAWDWRKHLHEALTMRSKRKDKRPLVLVAKEDKKPPGWRIGQPGRPPVALMLLDEWETLVRDREKWRRAFVEASNERDAVLETED